MDRQPKRVARLVCSPKRGGAEIKVQAVGPRGHAYTLAVFTRDSGTVLDLLKSAGLATFLEAHAPARPQSG